MVLIGIDLMNGNGLDKTEAVMNKILKKGE